jgi:Subtilase family
LAADRQSGWASHRGRALPGRVGRAALALLAAASLAAAPASAEEVFTSQAAASNATDSTWIPAPTRRAAVCIVDTGADSTPDTTNVVARFSVDGSDGSDISPIKHGTLMATIASAPKNDFGMVGAAPSVDAVAIRASRDGRTFGGLDVYAAVELCIRKRDVYNIKVVSLSLGGDGATITASTAQRSEFEDAIDSARAHGLNVVAAAGNSGRGVTDWPAGYGPALAVGAATGVGGRCSFASWGPEVDLWALGCPLDVGRPDATGASAWANGSSEATAFVAAVLTQMRGLDPRLSVDGSEQVLLDGARVGEAGALLDVDAAFRAAEMASMLAIGHAAIPLAGLAAPSGAGIEPQLTKSGPPSGEVGAPDDVKSRPSTLTSPAPPAMPPEQTLIKLSRPIVRSITVRHGLLSLRLMHRPRGVDALLDVYVRRRGKTFPSIAKRRRFRADTLRIRVSGAVSQLSIGYRDPTGVRERSEVAIVHPPT